MTLIRVLMVCMGNICRSPMAEALLRHKVAAAGLSDRITVDSAGTHSFYTGDNAHSGTLRVLKEHGIDYRGGARQFKAADVERFDYVLALDRDNLRDMQRVVRGPADNLHLFLSFAHAAGTTNLLEVPDPYYDGRFDETYVLIEKGVDALLAHLRAIHEL
jgi:protein-tyrosine phosphatase